MVSCCKFSQAQLILSSKTHTATPDTSVWFVHHSWNQPKSGILIYFISPTGEQHCQSREINKRQNMKLNMFSRTYSIHHTRSAGSHDTVCSSASFHHVQNFWFIKMKSSQAVLMVACVYGSEPFFVIGVIEYNWCLLQVPCNCRMCWCR